MISDPSPSQYQVRTVEGEPSFTVCCNGTPIRNANGDHVHLFSHEGDHPSRKAAYAKAREFVDQLNRLVKNSASIAAKTAQRAAQSN